MDHFGFLPYVFLLLLFSNILLIQKLLIIMINYLRIKEFLINPPHKKIYLQMKTLKMKMNKHNQIINNLMNNSNSNKLLLIIYH